jgi:hypothetical protein
MVVSEFDAENNRMLMVINVASGLLTESYTHMILLFC